MDDQTADHTDTLTTAAFDTATVRALEQPLLADEVPLMRMAASATARTILDVIDQEDWAETSLRICVLAGAGDNGGDGLYTGAMLAAEGLNVTAIAVGRTLHDAAYEAFLESGGHIYALDPANDIPGCPSGFPAGEAGQRLEHTIAFARKAHIIIDAMTGIGGTGALHGIPAALASVLGRTNTPPRRLGLPDDELAIDFPFVVAVDTPSGIGVDDGSLPGAYIPADVTMMYGALKPCAMLPPASLACGNIVLVDFGFDVDDATPTVETVDCGYAQNALRIPLVEDAKYNRGVVGLITGSAHYPGAAVLSSCAAARSNTGMVRYLGPERAQNLVLQALPEAVMGKGHVQAWVTGCGVPDTDHTDTADIQRTAISALLAHYSLTQDGADNSANSEALAMPPIVVDAGALDLLPDHVPPQVVITPHAGELARLLTRMDAPTTREEVMAEPLRQVQRACELTGATVVLKGAYTVIVGPDGNGGMRTLVCGRAPAFLATAGAGDVLAGITGALLAQRAQELIEDPTLVAETAAGAVYTHGLAAAMAAHSDQHAWQGPHLYGEPKQDIAQSACGHPIIASDVIAALPSAFDLLNTTARYED